MKEFWKSVKKWQNYGHEFGVSLFLEYGVNVNCVAHRRKPRLMRSGMARVNERSHSFTCHLHVYSRMEWTILPLLRKYSPDGATRAR